MKLTQLNNEIEKIGKRKKAILEVIDLKVAEDLKTFQAELKALTFKLNVLTWALVVIVMGFLGKLLLGV